MNAWTTNHYFMLFGNRSLTGVRVCEGYITHVNVLFEEPFNWVQGFTMSQKLCVYARRWAPISTILFLVYSVYQVADLFLPECFHDECTDVFIVLWIILINSVTKVSRYMKQSSLLYIFKNPNHSCIYPIIQAVITLING